MPMKAVRLDQEGAPGCADVGSSLYSLKLWNVELCCCTVSSLQESPI